MNNIEKFDGRKDIRAWLFVIAKNTYFRYCRRNKIYVGEEFSEIMQDSMQDTSPAVLDQIVQDETVRNLKRYAELIPEPYREVFHLRIYGELSFEQIGKCYQKSAGGQSNLPSCTPDDTSTDKSGGKVTWKNKLQRNPGYSAIIH